MKETTTKALEINTEVTLKGVEKDIFISGESMLGFLEDNYGTNEKIDTLYENIKWGIELDEDLLKEVKLLAVKEYFRV